jgi:hypothetical protein
MRRSEEMKKNEKESRRNDVMKRRSKKYMYEK